jgi:hypothetical protein
MVSIAESVTATWLDFYRIPYPMNISALFGLFRARGKLPRNIYKWAQSEHIEDTISSNNTNSQQNSL